MAKFILLYSGGTYPETPEEAKKVMDEWGQWMGAQGPALIDGGAPLGDKAHVGGGSDTGINGYSLYEATDMDAVKAACANHPHTGFGGSIEIAAFADMSG